MNNEEDDEDLSNITVSRFPCMPSLVALQQMRNRLHMAYVGKKLMKWTTQATGRELRKIAMDLNKTCLKYGDEVRNAYIKLARARYYQPNLNKLVLEWASTKASILVKFSVKPITGVKALRMEIESLHHDNYLHLGIGKGGQSCREAKYAWRHLLKRTIHFLEQRSLFELVDESNRSATKKMNVLGKLVIPRALLSIQYILQNLEELAREEFFRLKKVIEIKKKLRSKCDHGNIREECAKCRPLTEPTKPKVKPKPKITPVTKFKEPEVEELEIKEEEVVVPSPLSSDLSVSTCKSCHVCELSQKVSDEMPDKDLEILKEQIIEVVKKTEEIKKSGYMSAIDDLNQFLTTAEKLQETLKLVPEQKPKVSPACTKCRKKVKGTTTDMPKYITSRDSKSEYESALESSDEIEDSYIVPSMVTVLGTVSIEIKEKFKTVLITNEDGTCKADRRIIRTKKQVKSIPRQALLAGLTLQNLESPKTSSTSLISIEEISENMGSDNTKTTDTCKSEETICNLPISSPTVRNCLSCTSSFAINKDNIYSENFLKGSQKENLRPKIYKPDTESIIEQVLGKEESLSLTESEQDLLYGLSLPSEFRIKSKSNETLIESAKSTCSDTNAAKHRVTSKSNNVFSKDI